MNKFIQEFEEQRIARIDSFGRDQAFKKMSLAFNKLNQYLEKHIADKILQNYQMLIYL